MRVSTSYLPPLDPLLALGEPEFGHRNPWPDYLAMGFTAEHVPELMRMVADESLDGEEAADDEIPPERYAYIHAWRTLGLLRAEAAIGLLVDFMDSDNDWAHEELPSVLGMIGPAAFESLRTALSRWSLSFEPWSAGAAAAGLVEVAQRFPEMRDAAVAALARQLRWWARQDPDLNEMLVHDLVELHAVEAAPVIEEAFAADAVDMSYGADDWEDVQVALGLLPERITPRPVPVLPTRLRPTPAIRIVPPAAADSKRRRKARKPRKPKHRRR